MFVYCIIMTSQLWLDVPPRLFTHSCVCVLLVSKLLRLVGRLSIRKPVQPQQCVTKTDRPVSIRNRCVIDCLKAFLCCHLCVFYPCWYWGYFEMRLSQISLFLFLSVATNMTNGNNTWLLFIVSFLDLSFSFTNNMGGHFYSWITNGTP